jgi:hypothetical protein
MNKQRLLSTILFITMVLILTVSTVLADEPINKSLPARPTATGTLNQRYERDARAFVKTVEAAHPIFVLPDMLDDDYERIRDEFIDYASHAGSLTDFKFELLRYIRVFRDGHMSAIGYWTISDQFIQANWVVADDELFMVDNSGQKGNQVIAIGGIPVSQIFEIIETYFYFENMADRDFQLAAMSANKAIHEIAGAKVGSSITVTVQNGAKTRDNRFTYARWSYQTNKINYTYDFHHEQMGNVLYVDINSFQYTEPQYSQTKQAIRQAMQNGTRNFIFDLRDNGGGNSGVGQDLLMEMGIQVPGFGGHRRMSQFAISQRPGLREHFPAVRMGDLAYFSPNLNTTRNPNNVTVAVLTNNQSYSSAKMFAAWIQDGGLGVVIGEPSRNAASSFGDILFYRLPSTRIDTNISYTRWLRPDVNADQTTLWPDIPVASDKALEAALEYFANKNK